MLTFAITTTTKLAGLSLHKNGKYLGEVKVEVAKTHSTTILEQIDRLFEWTGTTLDEVENVLVSIGPGSFTGVRIAIAVVKGLFFNKNVRFFEVNELDALAYQAFYQLKGIKNDIENVKIYSLIDSRKEKVYAAVYQVQKNLENEFELKQIKDYEVKKLDNIIEEINNSENEENYLVGDAVLNYKGKIIEKIADKVKIFEDNFLKISTTTFTEMFFDEKLKETNIIDLKPDYLEKSQAERDKK